MIAALGAVAMPVVVTRCNNCTTVPTVPIEITVPTVPTEITLPTVPLYQLYQCTSVPLNKLYHTLLPLV